MNKATVRFALALLFFFLVAIVAMVSLCHRQNIAKQHGAAIPTQDVQGQRGERPVANWEASFFKNLEECTRNTNLPSLRTALFSGQDLEVRFWYDALPEVINGFIIRRHGDQWSAMGIRQRVEGRCSTVTQETFGAPKSGWEAAWKRLINAGLLTLPDGSQAECKTQVLDGGAFVVETNVNAVYRTYKYINPQVAKCDEAKRIVLIDGIIAEEFNTQDSRK